MRSTCLPGDSNTCIDDTAFGQGRHHLRSIRGSKPPKAPDQARLRAAFSSPAGCSSELQRSIFPQQPHELPSLSLPTREERRSDLLRKPLRRLQAIGQLRPHLRSQADRGRRPRHRGAARWLDELFGLRTVTVPVRYGTVGYVIGSEVRSDAMRWGADVFSVPGLDLDASPSSPRTEEKERRATPTSARPRLGFEAGSPCS
ncbi:hypothetical protein JHW43_008146 [Diplocarpon mali]|nr:hypothetical protein JHW43_008146 [Diplocarpon mali]